MSRWYSILSNKKTYYCRLQNICCRIQTYFCRIKTYLCRIQNIFLLNRNYFLTWPVETYFGRLQNIFCRIQNIFLSNTKHIFLEYKTFFSRRCRIKKIKFVDLKVFFVEFSFSLLIWSLCRTNYSKICQFDNNVFIFFRHFAPVPWISSMICLIQLQTICTIIAYECTYLRN